MLSNLLFEKPEPGDALSPGRRSYLPGLDGLRALSVIAVLIYHARPEWLPGGYLGVEVFFVISGFIITRALLNEWQENGRISLTAFWMRRARRLLPAVGLLLAGVMAYVAVFEPGEMVRLRGDVLAALAYVTNWHLILGNQSYFDSFQRPSILQHLWSLAIEEQFYLLWPLVLAFGLPILRKKGLAVLIVIGIAASAIGMALLYDPASDNSRAYFGTDTRAAGLLVGALLAFVMVANQGRDFGPWGRRGGALLGVVTLSLLVAASFWLDDSRAFLYQGGFLTVGLISALLILAASQRNVFAKMLSLRPLRWVGERSYGIYLWHWPSFMITWPAEASYGQLALQIEATIFIAAASYAFLEQPVREGLLGRAWQGLRSWSSQSWRYRSALMFSGTSAAAVVFSLFAIAVLARSPELPSYFRSDSIQIRSAVIAQDVGSVVRAPTLLGHVQTTLTALTTDERSCPTDNLSPGGAILGVASSPFGSTCPQPLTLFEKPEAAALRDGHVIVQAPAPTAEELADQFAQIEPDPRDFIGGPSAPALETPIEESTGVLVPLGQGGGAPPSAPPAQAPAIPPAAPAAPATVPSVTAIGDSVMLGAAYALAATIPGIDLDAAVGRQAPEAVALLQQKVVTGLLGQVVVLQIGNNGTLTADQFDQMMSVIPPDRKVIVLTVHVPRAWQDSNNAVIINGVARYANAVLLDWHGVGVSYPQVLYNDGIHVTPEGATYYSQLVAAQLGG